MGNWPAMLAAPALALTNLSVTYAMVTPSCAHQNMIVPNAVSALSLLACAWMSWGAWRNWRSAREADRADRAGRAGVTDSVPDRAPFLALVAFSVGALSCLAVLAQWFPQWVLSPCAS
jgi:threonine/homoserine/homoserine lactone efflux protein